MIYITENDRMIQIYKKNFTDIFDKDIKYMAEQIIDIYNYINMNRLIDSIVSSENIKIIFYQILDLIKNNKVKLNNITNIYGNKEVITNRILELLSNY
jgi:DNA-binding ferritin-like protein (Dps family)